jgi:hypothetical protein
LRIRHQYIYIYNNYCDAHQLYAKRLIAIADGKNVCEKPYKDCDVIILDGSNMCISCRNHTANVKTRNRIHKIDIYNKYNNPEVTIVDYTCAGYHKDYTKCTESRSNENIFCIKHQYITEFTPEDLQLMTDKKMNPCSNKDCSRLHKETTKQCLRCIIAGRQSDKIRMLDESFRLKKNANFRAKRYDKVYRAKQIALIGIEAVRAKNAINAKKYRKLHPEYDMNRHDLDSRIPDRKIKVTAYSAKKKNLEFNLTLDQVTALYTGKCQYCNDKYIKGEKLLGIDRVNNRIGYIVSNCVTACAMCNYIKRDLSLDIFMKRMLHILNVHTGLPNTQLHNDAFYNYFTGDYGALCKYASCKNLEITLSSKHFEVLSTLPCYLCNKQSAYNHINGIDRIDISKGYTVDNSVPLYL